MRRKTLPVILVLLLLSSHAPLVFAQTASSNNWSAVQQIKCNEKLFVRQKNGKEIKGLMIEASDTTLTIDRDGKPLSIARADVRQVYIVHARAEKGKWTLIGAGIGAGVGAGIGYAKYSPNVDDSGIWVPIALMFGTAIGAVSGLTFGQTTRKRDLVYSTD